DSRGECLERAVAGSPLPATMAKRFAPLGVDTVSPLNAPPVRMGLLAKLNLLAIGLIIATALGVAVFLVNQQLRDEQGRLRIQGLAVAAMLAEVADEAIVSKDMTNVAPVLDGLASDRDIGYAAIVDRGQHTLLSRGYAPAGRYVDVVVPVYPPPRIGGRQGTESREVIGYVRLGMSFDRAWARLRLNLIGALSVVAMLVIVAIVVTLLLTRRLVAPIRQLMRAARAVGAGKLDVYIPAKS